MEIITRKDRREGYLADQMTMYSLNYIFNESFELSGTFVKLVLGENNIDIDKIYDWCELYNRRLDLALKNASDELYRKASPYQKTIYFYKFVHDLGLEIRELINTVYNLLSDTLMQSGITYTYENIVGAYIAKLEDYGSSDTIIQCEHFLKIIDLFGMNTRDEINRLSKNVHDTFNNVIKNQYRINFEKNRDVLRNLCTDYVQMPTVWTGTSQITQTVNITTMDQNQSTYIYNPNGIRYTIQDSTSGLISTSLLNSYSMYPIRYHVDGWEDLLQPSITISRTVPLPSKKTLQKEKLNKKTPGVKRLNKSLKVFRKYIPSDMATKFLRCVEVNIPGELFNWSFKLKSRKDLVTYSEYINNSAISYDLYVMTKANIKISRCCIVFNGCPILDEVLAVYMMIKTGRELDIINGSGFFDKDKALFNVLIEPLIDKVEVVNDALDDLRNSMLTLDGSVQRTTYPELSPESIRNPAEIKYRIRTWLIEYLERYIPSSILEYTMNLDVSWGEAIDYEAFQLFNVNDFNHYVRPLVWSVNKP